MTGNELSPTERMLVLAMAGLTVMRMVIGGSLEITPHEALLAEWCRHVDSIGGIEGGFGTAAFPWMSMLMVDRSPLGVRFFAPLLAAAASAVLYRLMHSLGGVKVAAWSVALLNLTPAFNHAAVFLRPEMPGVLFLLCGTAAVWRALRRASAWDWHWPLAGILFGMGFLCWYGALAGVAATFFLLTISRRWRRQLARPGPWLLLADTALFVWPVVQWNQSNALAGWYHWLEHIRPDDGISWNELLLLPGKWALVVTPVIMAGMLWALWIALRRWGTSDAARFLAAFALVPLAAALACSLRGGARTAWIAPALPALCGLLPWAWEQCMGDHLRAKLRLQWLCVLPALVMTPAAIDPSLWRHVGLRLPFAHDPSREWRGWERAAAEVRDTVRQFARHAGKDASGRWKLLLIARDERLASVLNFYLPLDLPLRWPSGHPRVYIPESTVPESAYHLWPRYDAVRKGVNEFTGCTALYISDSEQPDPPDAIQRGFASWEPLLVFDVYHDGLALRRLRVFACPGYTGAATR